MTKSVIIIGGGPSGLMAADILSAHDFAVTVYERKSSLGRKFLMAGRGGLNITHSEDLDNFIQKYGQACDTLSPLINNFPPQSVRDWCEDLGQKTFIGSSGRVFPESFKASPLLRAWIAKLQNQNVRFMLNHDWQGWGGDNLIFKTSDGIIHVQSDATLLALGGASWPKLGSDGSWAKILESLGTDIAPLQPSNCGFHVDWTPIFANKYAGRPLKPVGLSFQNHVLRGEFIISEKGIEGGAIYALSAYLRNEINKNNRAQLTLDLKPDFTMDEILKRLRKPKSGLSLSNYLRKNLNLPDVAIGLLMERPDRKEMSNYSPQQLATIIKSHPLTLTAPFSMERAISTAGGITFQSMDENFMLLSKSGVFVTGEMLDWEAPTGGYLLQACLSSGVHVATGMMKWMKQKNNLCLE